MFGIQESRAAPAHLIQKARLEIQNIMSSARGVHFIMVCSTDGFELTSIYKKENYNNSKLAAVGSSILAMVSAFTHEINLTGCQTLTLDAENGKAILSSVAAPRHPLIIIVLAEKDILLGQVLYMLKQASQAIKAADI